MGKYLIILFGYLSVALSFTACLNQVQQKPKTSIQNCKIIRAVVYNLQSDSINSLIYNFKYDFVGHLIETVVSGPLPETHRYFYAGDSIYRNAESYLLGRSTDTMLVNDQDLVLYDKESDELSDPVIFRYQYSPISKLFHKLKNGSARDTYMYENGDLIRDIQYSDTTKLIYDSSRLAVRGNMDEFYQRLYFGVYSQINRHLLIKTIQFDDTVDYSYTFNKAGNIATVTYNQGTNLVRISYTYCRN